MDGKKRLWGAVVLVAAATGLVLLPQGALSRSSPAVTTPQSLADEPVPAYHAEAAQGELPATMNPELFPDTLVQNAYTVAARIKKTLYREPCYCHCDRSQGHTSLLDCFASKHGASCNICIGEALYSYEQSRKSKTAAQIRAGIMRGEWQSVDLAKYQSPLPAK
jgi:hypothetical protein